MKTYSKNQLAEVIEIYNTNVENGLYNQGACLIAEFIGLSMFIKGSEYKKHFHTDIDKRHVFKITLKKDNKQYTFNFGQSLSQGNSEPTIYDVLTCLQKYDVGTFENFCDEFGYDEDSRQAEKTYKAVVKEWQAMERLFSSEELEILQEIQ